MRKKFLGLVLTAALCTCVACAGESHTNQPLDTNVTTGAQATPEVTQEPTAVPTSESVTDNGASNSMTEGRITVTLTTDKSSYAAGEEIHYTLKVENNRELYVLRKAEITYKNTDGLQAANATSVPTELPELIAGESYELRGTLVGDATVFPVTGEIPASQYTEPADFDPYNGTKVEEKVSVLKTDETVTVRPYVEFTYGGQQVIIRAVVDFELGMQKEKFALSEFVGAKRTTCHDPSIFRDFDGKYYIFGTHMTFSSTENLKDWTNLDGTYRLSFDKETITAIRAWNKDETAGKWYDYLWAPDVIYNDTMKKYCMYLSANGDTWKSNIVLLTADSVNGPWSYAGSVVAGGFDETNWTEMDADEVLGVTELPERYIKNGVVNGKWGDEFPNCIDPTIFYDDDKNLWMAYGSWSGGIFILALDEQTGLRDYNVTYETNEHSDAYFGKKIAGGKYVSGDWRLLLVTYFLWRSGGKGWL